MSVAEFPPGYFTGYNICVSDCVRIDEILQDKVTHTLTAKDSVVDDRGNFDLGLLIGIIDTYSIFSGFFLRKNDSTLYNSLSMNLKITNLGQLTRGNSYEMIVYLKKQQGSYALYETQIFDKDNELVVYSLHLTKLIKAKLPKF
jgi:hypothetical protein